MKWAECTYCGQHATSVDHIIPVTYTMKRGKRKQNIVEDRSKAVPCCTECNSILGSLMYTTIYERADYIAFRLATKYAKLLASPLWSEEDYTVIDDGKLKREVKHLQHKRKIVLDRIRHANTIARLIGITTQDIWRAHDKGVELTKLFELGN